MTRKEALQVLARAAQGGLISTQQAAAALNRSPQATAVFLSRLQKAGWIARVQRGTYVVLPLEASTRYIEDPWVLATALFSPCYIGGWSAAEHWALTEQIFRETFVVTASYVRRRQTAVADTTFRLARVREKDVAGAMLIWRGPVKVGISDRERTITDALNHPDWVGGVRQLAAMLRMHRHSAAWNADKLLSTLRAHGSGAAIKRLGYLAESTLEVPPGFIETLHAARTRGIIKLDPSVLASGRINSRWGLRINVVLGSEGWE